MTCRRLVPLLLLLAIPAAMAQPAVPPLPGTAPARPAPASAAPAPAPAADPDAPPTSDPAPVVTAAQTPAAQPPAPAQPAAADPDAPPTTAAAAPPTAAPAGTVASATPDTPAPNPTPEADAPQAQPAVLPTVTKNYPLTPDGNARFLAAYAARPDAQKLDGGVMYRVLHAADPKSNGPISNGDTVTVSYRGWLIDGTVFDQTKPGDPRQFTLNALIPGWRTALMKMKVGDLWEIVIPADQAYGAEGRAGRIPANQTLVFVVSLAKVEYAG